MTCKAHRGPHQSPVLLGAAPPDTQPGLLPAILIIRGHLASESPSERGPALTRRLGGAPAHGRRRSPAWPRPATQGAGRGGVTPGKATGAGGLAPFLPAGPTHVSPHDTWPRTDRAASPRSQHQPDTRDTPNRAAPREGLPALQPGPPAPALGCPMPALAPPQSPRSLWSAGGLTPEVTVSRHAQATSWRPGAQPGQQTGHGAVTVPRSPPWGLQSAGPQRVKKNLYPIL